jgi:hypothetical protein
MMKEARFAQPKPIIPPLTIINPDNFPSVASVSASSSSSSDGPPETPWETDVRALEKRTGSSSGPLRSSISTASLRSITPSEQRDFLAKVRYCLQRGAEGVPELEQLLKSAEAATLTSPSISPHVVRPQPSVVIGAEDVDHDDRLPTFDRERAEAKEATGQYTHGHGHGPAAQSPHAAAAAASNPGRNVMSMGFGANVAVGNSDDQEPVVHSAISWALNGTDANGATVLMHACALRGSESVYSESAVLSFCRVLMRFGASALLADASGSTCLHRVALSGFEKVGRLLLIKGCPANVINNDGDAAIHIAAREGNTNFLELLADFGANCHLRNASARSALDIVGTTPKTMATRYFGSSFSFSL